MSSTLTRHRMARSLSVSCFTILAALAGADRARAQWVTFVDETATRLSAPATTVTADIEEKDYAWGDFDQDGDTDLVSVRKEPFTTPGRRENVLLMNVGGVLTDQTVLYASASSVPGSAGFLDLTNDRDVVAADVTGDGWLDIVTATTLSGSFAKSISHPRVYVNQGLDGVGQWQGFIFDNENRIPTMPVEPRFCGVDAGDVDQDGDLDLYFVDYQQGGPRPADLDDRLLLNDGNGFFTDVSIASMSAVSRQSSFGQATKLRDINNDGAIDIVKSTGLTPPIHIGTTYNNPANPGNFLPASQFVIPYGGAPYHVAVGDLNNDGFQDFVASDDGADRYVLSQGVNAGTGQVNWGPSQVFSFSGAGGGDDGFGGNSHLADLNNDGFQDVLICDMDVDSGGFSRRLHIYRNLGNAPNVTLQEQVQGSGTTANIGGILLSQLQSTYEVAPIDVNGDGWLDLVIGRSGETKVWINQPPVGVAFTYPSGQPFYIGTSGAHSFTVQMTAIGGAQITPASATLFYKLNGAGAFTSASMAHLGGGLFSAVFPALAQCTDEIAWYVSVASTAGTLTDPPSFPTVNPHRSLGATGVVTVLAESFEGAVNGWSVVNGAGLTAGAWQVADPNGTISAGAPAAPENDAESSTSATRCFVTQNGSAGGALGAADVDGGTTDLISPPADLLGSDGVISYSRWFYSTGGIPDTLAVSVSGNGASWTLVEIVSYNGDGSTNQWITRSFTVSDFIVPTATVQVRFRTSDQSTVAQGAGITEAGIDLFKVEKLSCLVCQPDLGFGGPGNLQLRACGDGPLSGGNFVDVAITGGYPQDALYVAASFLLQPSSILGGTVASLNPFLIQQVFTDAQGEYVFPAIPGGVLVGDIYLQAYQVDPNLAPDYLAFSNIVKMVFLP